MRQVLYKQNTSLIAQECRHESWFPVTISLLI